MPRSIVYVKIHLSVYVCFYVPVYACIHQRTTCVYDRAYVCLYILYIDVCMCLGDAAFDTLMNEKILPFVKEKGLLVRGMQQ